MIISNKRIGVAVGLLCLLIIVRAAIVDFAIGPFIGDKHRLFASCLAHDLKMFSATLLVAILLWNFARLRLAILSVIFCLLVLYSADVILFHTFSFRLLLSDVVKFSGEGLLVSQVLGDILKKWPAIALFALCISTCASIFFVPLTSLSTKARKFSLLGVSALLLLSWSWPEPRYWYQESFQNIVEVNRNKPVDRAYGEAFKAKLAMHAATENLKCAVGQNQKRNIIVLSVESLSSYHSKRLGGPWDATPMLDKLMDEHSYFPDFVANSFSTDGGLISLFAGRVPVPAQNRFRSSKAFAGFTPAKNNFYERLGNLGYQRSFLRTADKTFLGADIWMKELGFQEIEGAEGSFYTGFKRGQFNAVEDRVFYSRTLQWLDRRDVSRPFFLGMLTTSSHIPFVNPDTGKLDERGSIRYADAEASRFVTELQQRGFFENGVLIITGDHRAMTGLKKEEWNAYGELAYNRVPMIAIGATGLPKGPGQGRIAGQYQHTDLIPSVLGLVDSQICLDATQGVFLGPSPAPASVRVYTNAVRRDLVYLSHAEGVTKLFLNGDGSELLGKTSLLLNTLSNSIHQDRVLRGPVEDDILRLYLPAPKIKDGATNKP